MDIGRKRAIVVTGADRGLGYELVKKYLQRGDIVFAGKFKTNWRLLDKLKEEYSDTLHIIAMDVRCDASVQNAAKQIMEKTKFIDIIINNAGVWLDHNTGDILSGKQNYELIIEQFNVNALGAVRVTEALIKPLLNGFDKLIANLSSEAGSISINHKSDQLGYCMSKAALNMASSCILTAIRPHGGMVINLHPGWMQSVIGADASQDAEFTPLPKIEDVKFYTTPENTAAGFVKILDEPERFSGARPGFVNYKGDKMEY